MLKGLTNTIKNACNDIELTLSEYIVMNGQTIPIKAELNDDCYDNGNFVGTFILKELKFEASNEISYRNKEFEYYKRINGESIKIGTFITTEINNSDSEEVTKVVAMDYGLKTQVEYKSNLDYGSGNITLLDVWNECCELSGLESGVTEFTNSDFIVTDDQFTGTGATIRDVFIGIGLSSGSFIKVMNDDKIYPIFNEYDSNIKSGNNITLENDINNNPIDIQIDGKIEQNGTPTPDEPVEIKSVSGVENLLNVSNTDKTINGVTFTKNSDGTITVNGTATATTIYNLLENSSLTLEKGTYILSGCPNGGSDSTYKLDIPVGSYPTDYGADAKVIVNEETTYNSMRIVIYSGTTLNDLVFKPMLSKKMADYVPYGHWLKVKNINKLNQEQSIMIDMNKYDENGNIIDYYELCSIDNTKDELNIDKDGNVSITQNIGEAVLDGTEIGWGKSGATSNVSYYYSAVYGTSGYKFNDIDLTNVGTTSSTTPVPAYCDYFQSIAGNKIFTNIKGLIFNYISNTKTIELRLGFGLDTTITTVDLLKTWLSTHPITVKYILAKPQTINLGKITPLKLLEGTNNITTNDELQPNMKIEYSVINEIVEEYTELEDKRDTQPITCVRLGMSQIEGENVDIQDEDLIKKYGEHWLIINDNPFAYTQDKRVQLINAIFNKVKGFGYSAFVSKTSFKPYLTCGDVIKFKNKAGELVKSIVLRYNHNFDEINLEAPSETSATVNYVYPTKDIDLIKRTEIIVDKNTNQITSLTQQTTTIQNDLQQNYYDKTQTNQLIQTSGEGITNTFSEAGGNNIFRNTGLWFEDSSTSYYIYPKSDLYPSNQTFTNGQRAYEFWDGLVLKQYYEKAANLTAMSLQNGYLEQKQQVPNGNYTVSFKYKKLIESATTKVIINNVEYNLTKLEDTEFRTGEQDSDGNYITQPLEVTDGYIFVRFYTNVNNSTIIYDLMVNAGSVKLAYSQNQNETTTDTVNISKGITITSSNTDTTFKANSDGIRTLNKNNETLSEFTDKGMKNKQIEVTDEATIVQVLWQNVGDQTWLTRL